MQRAVCALVNCEIFVFCSFVSCIDSTSSRASSRRWTKQVGSGPPEGGVGWAAAMGDVGRAAGWLDLALGEATGAVGFCDVTIRQECAQPYSRDMGSYAHSSPQSHISKIGKATSSPSSSNHARIFPVRPSLSRPLSTPRQIRTYRPARARQHIHRRFWAWARPRPGSCKNRSL